MYHKIKRSVSFAAISAGLFWSNSGPLYAQTETPPERSTVDENGVDLSSGMLSLPSTDISIGSGAGELTHSSQQGMKYPEPNRAYLYIVDNVAQVVRGSSRTNFNSSGTDEWTSTKGDGEKIVKLSTTDYRLSAADGTEFRFSMAGGWDCGYDGDIVNCGGGGRLVSKIVYPDQSEVDFRYRRESGLCADNNADYNVCLEYFSVVRLQSVSNSRGYMLKYDYGADGNIPTNYDDSPDGLALVQWQRLEKVRAVNLADEYCDPDADDCSLSGDWQEVNYSLSGNDIHVTDDSGGITKYDYDNNSKLTTITPPGTSINRASFSYDGTGKVSSSTVAGVTTTYNYSTNTGANEKTTVRTKAGNPETFVFSLDLNLLKRHTDNLSNTTSYLRDNEGRVTRVTYAEGNYSSFTYDDRGNLSEARQVAKPGTGLADIVTSAGFLSSCSNPKTCNKPIWTRDAKAHQTNDTQRTDYTYDPTHGGVLTVTAPATSNGARPQTRFTYAQKSAYYKNSSGSIVAGPGQWVLTKIAACQTASSCTGGSDEVRTTVNYGPTGVANNLLPVSTTTGTNSLSSTNVTAYDNRGNPISTDGPLSGTADKSYYFYDALNRQRGIIGPDPDGSGVMQRQTQRLTYNAESQVTKLEVGRTTGTSEANLNAMTVLQKTENTYDSNGRLNKAFLKSAGGTNRAATQYSYDTKGRLDCAAQRMNPAVYGSLPTSACTLSTQGSAGPDRITRNHYDGDDRVLRQTDAMSTSDARDTWKATYNKNNQITSLTDAENNKTTYVYDGHFRLYRTQYPHETIVNTSNSGDYAQLGYDANGNVTSLRRRDGNSIYFTFDNLNRMTLKNLPGTANDVYYTYDLLNRQKTARLVSSTGAGLINAYDGLGRLTSATDTTGGGSRTTSYLYDTGNRRTRMTWDDGFYVTYNYKNDGSLHQIKENGNSTLATYAYDAFGRPTTLTYGNGTVQTIGYDDVSRLVSLNNNLSGTANDVNTAFSYNPASQITQRVISNDTYAWAGDVNVNRNYASNGLNQYLSAGPASFTYDARGNMINDGTSSYGYDLENRLITGPNGVTLSYDPYGRLHKTTGTAITRMGYDGVDLIGEYNGSGSLLRRYVHGPGADDPLVWYEGTGTGDKRYYHKDERGSVIALSNASGGLHQMHSYSAYGIPAETNTGRFQYTGQQWLSDLELYHYKARIYSPTMGRFLQTDPIGYGDGLNIYAYVGNDPVNNVDPTGLTSTFARNFQDCKTGISDYGPHGSSSTIQCFPTGIGGFPRSFSPSQLVDNIQEDIEEALAEALERAKRAAELAKETFCGLPPLGAGASAAGYLGVGGGVTGNGIFDLKTGQVSLNGGLNVGVGLGAAGRITTTPVTTKGTLTSKTGLGNPGVRAGVGVAGGAQLGIVGGSVYHELLGTGQNNSALDRTTVSAGPGAGLSANINLAGRVGFVTPQLYEACP